MCHTSFFSCIIRPVFVSFFRGESHAPFPPRITHTPFSPTTQMLHEKQANSIRSSVLHLAAEYQADPCVELLLAHGADHKKRTAKGESPLQVISHFPQMSHSRFFLYIHRHLFRLCDPSRSQRSGSKSRRLRRSRRRYGASSLTPTPTPPPYPYPHPLPLPLPPPPPLTPTPTPPSPLPLLLPPCPYPTPNTPFPP